MPTLSRIEPSKSIPTASLTKLFSREHFQSIQNAVCTNFRKRKFDFFSYTLNTISNMNTDEKVEANRLSCISASYKETCSSDISNKCIHNYISKDSSREIIELLTSDVLAAISAKISKGVNKSVKQNDVLKLIKYLKLNDIILIDGTEVELSRGAIDNLGIKAKGRNTITGESPNPCIKLHIAYSVLKQTFEYVEITGGTDSERDRVYFKKFKNCLLIMDAGYCNDTLENEITQSGNFFIIKGKKNMACSVTKSFNPDGSVNPEHKNLKVSELPYSNLDLSVKKRDNTSIRVVTKFNPNAKHSDNKRVILRTNLDMDLVNIHQLFNLYRIRWTLEIFNKCLKSGSALASINSTNKNIIIQMVLFSLIASLIKTYISFKATVDFGFNLVSQLKVHQLSRFKKLFIAFMHCNKSTIYQIIKELTDHVRNHCFRTSPSKRDALLLKDQPLLIKAILENSEPNQLDA